MDTSQWESKEVFLRYNSKRLKGEPQPTVVEGAYMSVAGSAFPCFFEKGLTDQRARELLAAYILEQNPELSDDELDVDSVHRGWVICRGADRSEALFVSERGCQIGSPL